MKDPLLDHYVKIAFENWMWKKHPVFQVLVSLLGLTIVAGGVFSIVAIFFFSWWWKLLIGLAVVMALGRLIGGPIHKDYLMEFLKEHRK